MRASRIILIIVVLLLIGGGTVGGLYFRGPIKKLIGLGSPETGTAEPAPKKPVKPEDMAFCDLPDLLITLDSRGGRGYHIVKLTVALQLNDRSDQPRVQAYVPRVVDVFQNYVRQLRIEDVAGVPQMQKLRGELLPRVNAVLAPAHVDDILFREVQVQ
jgi:flagellar FliL protein